MMVDIGLEIKNLNNMIHRHFINLKTTKLLNELTRSNGYIIIYLVEHSGEIITQKNIENALGITRSTASIVLSNMEKNNLITRKIMPNDSRCKSIHITNSGIKLYESMELEKKELEKKLKKGFSDEELSIFFDFVRRFKENLREEK